TGKEIAEKTKTFKDLLGKSVRVEGDEVVMFCRTWNHVPVCTASAPQAGRYRVRVSAYAINTDGKPLPMVCTGGQEWGRDEKDIRAVRDVPADHAAVIEGEFELKARQCVDFKPWT